MLAIRIIPCLDVKDARVVKGVCFSNLRDSGSPAELAAEYQSQGADEIVLLDISATLERRCTQIQTIKDVREVLCIPLTVGGGVTSVGDAEALLVAGADRVAINTAAVSQPQLLRDISETFGRQCTVVALDAAANSPTTWEVVTNSGRKRTGIDALEFARLAEAKGAGEILLTSWDRDGTRLGYDIALLECIAAAVSIPVIASGGAATLEHFLEAIRAGADAILAASVFHEGVLSVKAIKNYLRDNCVEVRL
ncbi:MAG: imidazole glycerol phosphate synthase subunit HisF [Deltaproteobacteria bacterium]|nr:imidazole glycerol phosphate synthase subunit HisF [Deltaproteobacteria bacterium]